MSNKRELMLASTYAVGMSNMQAHGECVMDRHSIIRFCNSKFAEMFGYEWSEVIGLHMSKLIADGQAHPHGTPDKLTDMSRYVMTTGVTTLRDIGKVVGVCKDGSKIITETFNFRASLAEGGEFLMAGSTKFLKNA